MKITAQLVFVVLCVMWMGCTQASRILAIFIVGSRSPKLAAMPILEELAVRGHQITLVSTFKSYLKEPGNIKEIVVSTDVEESFKEMDWFTSEKSGFVKILEMIWQLSDQVKQGYEDLVGNQDFISLLESKSVDVVIADAVVNEFAYVISDHLKVPLLLYCSGGKQIDRPALLYLQNCRVAKVHCQICSFQLANVAVTSNHFMLT